MKPRDRRFCPSGPHHGAASLGVLLRLATARLRQAGCETPRLDAEVLLAQATGLSRATLLGHSEMVPTPAQARLFEDLIDRRQDRWPVAYLIGHREFMSLDFLVSPGVLVPRPETELLVEVGVNLARSTPSTPGVGPSESGCRTPAGPAASEGRDDGRQDGHGLVLADVGTGCGVVAITLSRLLPGARIFATDLAEAALVLARRNAQRLGVEAAVTFRQGDLLEALAGERPRPRLDGVVANLPYVPDSDWESLPPEVRDYEPPSSLLGGSDGLDLYRRLALSLPDYLSPGGFVCLEVGPGQGQAASVLLSQTGLFVGPVVHRDLAGRERVIAARGLD